MKIPRSYVGDLPVTMLQRLPTGYRDLFFHIQWDKLWFTQDLLVFRYPEACLWVW